MKLNHAILVVAVDKENNDFMEILHACFYEEPIDENNFKALKKELKTDKSFGLRGRDDYILIEAPEEVLKVYWDELGKEVPEN